MPLYEYKCPVCGKRTEVQRKIAEMDAPIGCETCSSPDGGAIPLTRIPTAPSPIFPGASSWRSR